MTRRRLLNKHIIRRQRFFVYALPSHNNIPLCAYIKYSFKEKRRVNKWIFTCLQLIFVSFVTMLLTSKRHAWCKTITSMYFILLYYSNGKTLLNDVWNHVLPDSFVLFRNYWVLISVAIQCVDQSYSLLR